MPSDPTFLELLIKSLRAPSRFDSSDEIAPAAILWPDGEREWEPLLPGLRLHLPILTLGPYNRAERTGPAIWIRCVLARALHSDTIAPNAVPVVYLPGVPYELLSDSTRRPRPLEPLAELLFSAVVWCRPDGSPWTPAAFLQDGQHGPGVELRQDDFTRKAMLRALPLVAGLPHSRLQDESPWKAKDFEALVGAGIEELIRIGESASLEFKSSCRWNMEQNKKDVALEHSIIKTVAGFLNTNRGGTLIIGIENNGNVCGIETDYQSFGPEYANPDYYEQYLMAFLLNTFGKEFAAQIHPTFHTLNGKTLCKVVVDPAPTPAFVPYKDPKGQRNDYFYLRVGNATNALGLRDTVNYFRIRWIEAA